MNFKAVKLQHIIKNKSHTEEKKKVVGTPIIGARSYKIIVLDDGSGVVEALHYPLTGPITIGRRFRIGKHDFIIKQDES